MSVGWDFLGLSTKKSLLTTMNNTYGMQGDMYQDLKSSLNDVELLNNLDGKTCKYYDIDEFQTKFKNNSNNFSVFSLNIRSLTGKLNRV